MQQIHDAIDRGEKYVKYGMELNGEAQTRQKNITLPCDQSFERMVDCVLRGQTALRALAEFIRGDYDHRLGDTPRKTSLLNDIEQPFSEWVKISQEPASIPESRRDEISRHREKVEELSDLFSEAQDDISKAMPLIEPERRPLDRHYDTLRETYATGIAELRERAKSIGYLIDTAKKFLEQGGIERIANEILEQARQLRHLEDEMDEVMAQKGQLEGLKDRLGSLDGDLTNQRNKLSGSVTDLNNTFDFCSHRSRRFAKAAKESFEKVEDMEDPDVTNIKEEIAERILEVSLPSLIDRRVCDRAEEVTRELFDGYEGQGVTRSVYELRIKIDEKIKELRTTSEVFPYPPNN